MGLLRNIAFVIAGIIQLVPNQAVAAIPGPLKAGAGRVDITRRERNSSALYLYTRSPFCACHLFGANPALVIKIESLSGQLIAVYMNYAMHANSLFLNGMVSGDFPEAHATIRIGDRSY